MNSCNDTITVVRYNASLRADWDAFVSKCRNSTFLFMRGYMDYHSNRFTDCSMLFYKKTQLMGLLPANVAGNILYSHGGLTYGGFLLPVRATVDDVMSMFVALRDYLQSATTVEKIIYRPVPHIYSSYPSEEDLYALFRYDARLTERRIASVVFRQSALPFSTLRMRKVKLATKHGLTVCEDCDYAAFWEVLQENLRVEHNASPVHTLCEMETLAARFPSSIKLFRVVDGDGATVAGTVLYVTPRVVRVQYIGSVSAGREVGAVDFLFHYLLHNRYASCEYFDFGTSVECGGRFLNKGLIFQKEGFGGRAVVYDAYELNLNSIVDG